MSEEFARQVAEAFGVSESLIVDRPTDVPGEHAAEQREWLSEFREALARSAPCTTCALPEYAHADGLLPDWVRPHEFERHDADPTAVAVITTVVPPEGS